MLMKNFSKTIKWFRHNMWKMPYLVTELGVVLALISVGIYSLITAPIMFKIILGILCFGGATMCSCFFVSIWRD